MVRPRAQAAHGRRFGAQAGVYDEVRPGYPQTALDLALTGWDRSWSDLQVCDLGAGTGILSRRLLALGTDLIAVDPDTAALERNPAPTMVGTAEATGLEAESFDLVTVAQAWHWFDESRAAAEVARILRPGGRLLILINQLDVRVDWVLRLSRIMHAGDVYRPQYRPQPGSGLTLNENRLVEFATEVSVDGIVDLARTRSYWLRSDEKTRNRVESNLREYLRVEHPIPDRAELPYMCLAYLLQRR
ncbi:MULTISPECIES: class I SAM-dependent methyltransferase [Brevibacterium]|uniref:Methyltransferase domain-containing protein n=2 Tax=Brevibacterium linens TaxID=1703 RepID=A0A2H1HQP5_BRELN|nr:MULTISPECIES: class I SAM-dependent methyltransferase [Brevibacterium]AZU00779.1 class I SAM-dependent methyltransferase [Brevibacterium linens]KAB1947622.1 class I SAM-dependent methyltransferase [Brevibacterium linens ATCC 9172]SMX65248.1 Methyltransferase domain-containing protein [Brevibacterium linens]SMX88665.1 Methyltransferase domain-containing protein [Brevibacterium linens ATCC 9172]